MNEMNPVETENGDMLPAKFYLSQNYPNPFGERTTIKYCIPNRSMVAITIMNSKGEIVKSLVDEEKIAGTYEAEFFAGNLIEGIYFCHIKAGSFTETKKMLLKK
jgi:hypothetical protein